MQGSQWIIIYAYGRRNNAGRTTYNCLVSLDSSVKTGQGCKMNIRTVLFDLDGTLLPMDQDEFTKGYFGFLTRRMAAYGYDAGQLVDAVWKGMGAMVKNDGAENNEEAFWKQFFKIYGEKALSGKWYFDAFYEEEFKGAKDFCGYNPKAAWAVHKIKDMGLSVALATNPIFPMAATETRIRWAGLEPSDFILVTAYENSRYCKPNPAYYREILEKLNLEPEECLMVGNDVTEDMAAAKIGMNVFLLTDCLVNKEREDINRYPRGSFEQMLGYLENQAV